MQESSKKGDKNDIKNTSHSINKKKPQTKRLRLRKHSVL